MLPSTTRVQIVLLAIVCASGISCHRHTAQAAPPPAMPAPGETGQPAPAPPSESTGGANSAPANTAPASASSESSPATTPAPKPVEPKPKPVVPPPASEPPAPKPAPPQITPRISPAQEAELKSQTEKSIAEAEGNLRRTSGRQLNDAQREMVEKIQSFLVQAREASEIPEWSRARILADKARLLSIELANSL